MDKKIFSDEEVFEQIKQPYSARFVKELARSRKLESAGHYTSALLNFIQRGGVTSGLRL